MNIEFFCIILIYILLINIIIYKLCNIKKGKTKFFVFNIVNIIITLIFNFLNYNFINIIIIFLVTLLYVIFYNDTPIKLYYKKLLYYFFINLILVIIKQYYINLSIFYILEINILAVFVILFFSRKYINILFISLLIIVYCLLMYLTVTQDYIIKIILTTVSILIFVLCEIIYIQFEQNYKKTITYFQQNILSSQYNEIKNIYMDMRGWRHDFHNHIETAIAYLSLQQYDETKNYLINLINSLKEVDTYIKSGNLMIDAVLNSKLTIANNYNISINCKANVNENIIISDIDICVILGNILENAIESCIKTDDKNKFLRIYINQIKNQLYISVQNSAKEDINFNEKNYISSKRGEHGFGIKRVKILVDKYNGFLNLKNEPGIFATEVTIPLTKKQN